MEQTKKMASHTPGPWQIADDDARFIYALNSQGANRFSVQVQPGYDDAGRATGMDERAATARLIAAAPELLAALQEMLLWMPSGFAPQSKDRAIRRACDVVAKAEG